MSPATAPKQAELVPAEPQTATPARIAPTNDAVAMFERLATDPNVDVTKLERLIEMQERIISHQARAAFNTAFAAMQGEIPIIAERGKTDKGFYATLEDIVEKVRPILQRHGFTLSHRTEWPDTKTVRVVGILRHREGHEVTSEFLSAADQSGSKNAIQALGSAVSYGRRYTAKDLLNIATRHEDDDGATAHKFEAPEAPDGYDEWTLHLSKVADGGWGKLSAEFSKGAPEYRKFLTSHDKDKWKAMRQRAEKVTS